MSKYICTSDKEHETMKNHMQSIGFDVSTQPWSRNEFDGSLTEIWKNVWRDGSGNFCGYIAHHHDQQSDRFCTSTEFNYIFKWPIKRKLIRDKLFNNPKWTEDYVKRNCKDERIQIGSKEHWELLYEKLDEELAELDASEYKDRFEYADVMEVLRSMAFLNNIDWETILTTMEEKFQERGSFVGGSVINRT